MRDKDTGHTNRRTDRPKSGRGIFTDMWAGQWVRTKGINEQNFGISIRAQKNKIN